MTDNRAPFRTVTRGYDPIEVDRRIAELTRAAASAQQHARELHSKIEQLSATESISAVASSAPEGTPPDPAPKPDFAALGVHIGQILEAAEGAAARVRSDAEREAAALGHQAKQAAERLVADARQLSDAMRQAAETQANQRVDAAEEQLTNARRFASKLQAEADQARDDATRKAATMVADADQEAKRIVADATKRVEQMQASGQRALAAATEQRDHAVSQLTGLWHELAAVMQKTGVLRTAPEPTESGDVAPAVVSDVESGANVVAVERRDDTESAEQSVLGDDAATGRFIDIERAS